MNTVHNILCSCSSRRLPCRRTYLIGLSLSSGLFRLDFNSFGSRLKTFEYVSTIFYDKSHVNMDQPSMSSRLAEVPEKREANNEKARTSKPMAKSPNGGQKARQGDARGGAKTRGARGGRNKRSDMGRAEWRYGLCTIPLCPFSLINQVVPR